MTFLDTAWNWLSNEEHGNTLAFFVGGIAVAIGALWQAYVRFSRKQKATDEPSNFILNKFDGITLEQYKAGLKQRKQEIRTGATQARAADKERDVLLEKLLAHIQAKLEHPEGALEETKAKLAGAYEFFDDLKSELPPEQIKQARDDLSKGETVGAESAFKQVLASGNQAAAEAAFQLGQLAFDRMDYLAAAAYYEQATALQPDNPLYLNQAGFLVKTLGHHVQAESLYQRALAIWETSLGPDHPAVAQTLNNLAGLSYAQGHYAEAEPLLQRTLAIREKALGPEHPNVASALENYAALLRKLGRTGEAEKMEARAQGIWAKR